MNLCQKSETKQTITARRLIYQAPLLTPLPHLMGTLKGIERMTQTIVYYLIALNIVTFFVYGIDKWKAKRAKWRIREASLLGLAVLGGSIGALLGMNVWRHKTMHKGGTRDVDNIVGGYQFKYGLPLIVLSQVALIYLINQNLR